MMQLSTAAKMMNATMIGPDATFESVSTDSRKVGAQQLFFALKGDRFDGHAFAKGALEQGAASVVVNASANVHEALSRALVVDDTYDALGELAASWRAEFSAPLIGITGSNGKTTVKEMLAAILGSHLQDQAAVLATKGNLNNHIGMPLTLLEMNNSHQYAVIEMGMNHTGEIQYLTNIAQPDVVLINNAGSTHLGELGSLQAIAEAKGEIIEGLKADGTAVLNGDDDYYPLWQGLANGKKIVTFGMNEGCDVRGDVEPDGSLNISHQETGESVQIQLQSRGLHNAKNALAASAVTVAIGLPLSAVEAGLVRFTGVIGRLQTLPAMNEAIVIDDTYNASPSSMQAAIDVLADEEAIKILVVGDMGELGNDAEAMHAQLGEYAQAKRIDYLYTFGLLSQAMSDAFGEKAQHFEAIETLIDAIKQELSAGVTVLVKGSRFMKMERVVNAIKATEQKKEKQ